MYSQEGIILLGHGQVPFCYSSIYKFAAVTCERKKNEIVVLYDNMTMIIPVLMPDDDLKTIVDMRII